MNKVKRVSIIILNDGYFIVGYEGENKAFVPSWDDVLTWLDARGLQHPHLTSENPKIRILNKSLQEHLKL